MQRRFRGSLAYANVVPGTYDVGIVCHTDRPNLVTLRGAESTAVAYAD